MSRFKTFITNGEFDFWKFAIMTLISMAFSAGVLYATFGNAIKANAQGLVNFESREQNNKGQFFQLVDVVNDIRLDMKEVKTDVKWLVNNN